MTALHGASVLPLAGADQTAIVSPTGTMVSGTPVSIFGLRSIARQQEGADRGWGDVAGVAWVVDAAVDEVAEVGNRRDVVVDRGVPVAVGGDVEARHGEPVARGDREDLGPTGPPAVRPPGDNFLS
jgi:hypothetical protein